MMRNSAFYSVNSTWQVSNAYKLSIIDSYDKIKSFQMKVDLWLSKQKGRKTYMLPVLASRLEDSGSDINLNVGILSEI
jgi:hypothetical protein